ncbi:MAG: HPr family phosphocarrier protein [Brevinema sp.]
MHTVNITISNDTGLHTRPGNELVKLVKSLEGVTVELEKGDKKIKANSLLQVMSLGVKKGDTLTVYINGGDEEKIGTDLIQFFANLKD